jgi:hypothetical protein
MSDTAKRVPPLDVGIFYFTITDRTSCHVTVPANHIATAAVRASANLVPTSNEVPPAQSITSAAPDASSSVVGWARGPSTRPGARRSVPLIVPVPFQANRCHSLFDGGSWRVVKAPRSSARTDGPDGCSSWR